MEEITEQPLLHEIVTARIAEAIVRGEFGPGERLSEERLAERLGVSRSPVREALRSLANSGLVIYEARKGMTIANIDRHEVVDFFQFRTLIQCECIRLATPNLHPAQIEELKLTFHRMEDAARENHLHEYLFLVRHFYEIIEDACPNQVLVESVRSISLMAMRYRSVSIRVPGRMEESLRNHREFLDALVNGDAVTAVSIAERLLQDSLRGVLVSFNDGVDDQ